MTNRRFWPWSHQGCLWVAGGAGRNEAGLCLILSIDGKPTAGRTLADCVNLIRGEAGTKIKFTAVDPDSGQTNKMELTRETITFR